MKNAESMFDMSNPDSPDIRRFVADILQVSATKRINRRILAHTELRTHLNYVADELVVELIARVADRVVSVSQFATGRVVEVGVVNNIYHRLPFKWAQRRVKWKENIHETHLHHNCPHLPTDPDIDHLSWLDNQWRQK